MNKGTGKASLLVWKQQRLCLWRAMVANKPGLVCHSGRHRPPWLVESNKRFGGPNRLAGGGRRARSQQNQMEPEWTPDCGRRRPRQNNSLRSERGLCESTLGRLDQVCARAPGPQAELGGNGRVQVNSNASLTNTPVGGGAGGSNSLNSSSNILLPQVTPVSTSALQTVKSEPNFDYRTGFISPPNLTQAFISQLKQTPQTPK